MRILKTALSLVIVIGIVAVIVLAANRVAGGGGSSGYLVRAVFDNSSFVIPGEEVKVAGVTVGTIHAVQLTEQNKAAVVLQITDRRFIPFRTDAHCEIGIESLLGEQFVQCTPTQPRAAGVPTSPPLSTIPSGPNRGEHLLPVSNTTAPVGFDLLQDIQRLPQQEALRLIITGLGAGLDANGQELNQALLSADPALQDTDKVIAVLASQDRTLAQLTDESARILSPLAAQRAHLGGFFQHAGIVAEASAEEGQAIQQNFEDFPPFLRQFEPAANRLTRLAEQMTPALQALNAQAPAIDSSVKNLGPLAVASIPAFDTLGKLAVRGESIFPRVHTLAQQLLKLGEPLLPLATDIAGVAQSFDNAGGIEDVMRFIYYYTGAVNGEDSLGHYLRAHVTLGAVQRNSSPLETSGSASFACNRATNACPATEDSADVADVAKAATSKAAVASTSSHSAATAATSTVDALLRYLIGK